MKQTTVPSSNYTTHWRTHIKLCFCLWTETTEFHASDLSNLEFLFHMRKKILKTPCLFLSLFTSINLCSGKFGTPITDDVSKLSLLKQNIPTDYEIPVHYIPKEVSGMCWVVLNIYPLEQSLRQLANMFGAISSNKDNIIVFIAMLKSLRFTFDHEELETAMQVFQCHYREGNLMSGLYFDYIKEVLHSAAQGTVDFPCQPPPCLNPQQTPGSQEEDHERSWSKRSPLLLILIPLTACVFLIVWLVTSRRRRIAACDVENSRPTPSDMTPTISITVPLHTLTCTADTLSVGELVTEHERG